MQSRLPAAAAARPVVGTLVRTVVSPGEAPLDDRLVEHTTDAILEKIGQMPSYLGAPMLALTLAFDAAGFAWAGRPFRFQTLEQRHRQLTAWRDGPVPPFRDFAAFYEKMANFIYFSLVEEGA